MGYWMKRPGAGAAAAKLAPSRPSRKSRRATSCLPRSPITVSGRQAWQTILVIAPLLAGASAGSLAVPYQVPPAPNLEPSGPGSPQNPVSGWKKNEGDLGILSAEGHPLLCAAARDLHPQCLLASPAVNAPWGSSENAGARVVGEGPGSTAPSDLRVNQESSSKGPVPGAPLSPAKTTNTLPKGPLQGSEPLVKTGTSPSLMLQAEGAGGTALSSPLAGLPTASLPLLLRAIRSSHVAAKTALPTGRGQDPAPPSPTSATATVLRSENLTARGHVLLAEQDPPGKWPSSTRMANIDQGSADPSSTAPAQTGLLSSQHGVEDFTPAGPETRSPGLRGSSPPLSAMPAAAGGAPLDAESCTGVPLSSSGAPLDAESRTGVPLSSSGAPLDAESRTGVPLSSVFHHEGSTVPRVHPVSPVVAFTSSSDQSPRVESAKSQWPEATSELPSGNDGFTVTSGSPKAESSADVATDQLATETTTFVPHSPAAGRPGFDLPLATTPLDLKTAAAGPLVESHPTLGYEHAQEKDCIAGFSVAPRPSRLGTAVRQEDTLSMLLVGGTDPAWKEGASPAAEELSGAPLALGGGAVSSAASPQSWPASSNPTLGALHSGGAETGRAAPLLQAGSSETAAKSAGHGEWAKTDSPDEEEQVATAAGLSPAVSVPRRSDAAAAPPPSSAPLAFSGLPLPSKDPAEPEPPAAPPATRGAGGAVTHRHAAPSSPSLPGTGEATRLPGVTAAGMARTGPLTAGPRASSAWELALPSSVPAAASPAGRTVQGRDLVAPASAAGPTGAGPVDSSWAGTASATLEAHTAAAAGQIAGGAQARSPDPRPPSRARPGASATPGVAPGGPTGAPELGLQRSAATEPSDASVPEAPSVPALPARDPTALPLSSTVDASPSGSQAGATVPASATRSTQALPGSRAATALPTTAGTLPGEPSAGAPSVPSRTTSARPLAASQLTGTRRALSVTSGLAGAKGGTEATGLGASGTAATTRAQSGSVAPEGRLTSLPVPTSTAPVLSPSTRKGDWSLSAPTLPLPGMYVLPLRFRLTRIDFTESLKNKSSEDYKKLEKELKLTIDRMLSAYEGFVQTNILHFLNGSVVVESEAVFQAGGPAPTSSDLLRTIVTQVESGEVDAAFDWRVDVASLWSNGFSLANLEPEKLAVSFAVLGAGPQTTPGGAIAREYLESLKGRVIVLLGVRYAVRNISLAQAGGTEIRGEISLDTRTRVDVRWALDALAGLANCSVDLASLSINGSRLSVKVFPVTFLVTNRIFDARMSDRSSAEHRHIARDLSDALTHVLGKSGTLLQVAIREITGGSLVCHADVIFQHPAPRSKDILQTLARSVGPEDYLDSSSLQVDPFSFTVAGDGLEPPLARPGVPAYGIAIVALCSLALVAFPIGALLPKLLGRKNKIIINHARDPEAAVETFELDNPGFLTVVDEDDGRPSSTPSETAS